MDEFLVKRYSEQEGNIEKSIQNAIDTYDCDKIGMYGK